MTWTVLKNETIFERAPFLRVRQQSVEVRPGQVIDNYYQIDLRDFAVVIPFLKDGTVEMIRQYKHGAGCETLSFPAGYVDAGEDPATAAARELREETGLEPGQLIPLGGYVDNGNQRLSTGHYFAALDCTRGGQPEPGDLEDFAYESLTEGQISDAMRAGQLHIVHHVAAWGLWQVFQADQHRATGQTKA